MSDREEARSRDAQPARVGKPAAVQALAMFATTAVPQKWRAELWRSYNHDGHTPSQIEFASDRPFSGGIETAGSLRFGTCHIDAAPHRIIRTRDDIRRGSQDLVAVFLVNRGTCVVEQNGRAIEAHPGDILLVFLDAPHRITLDAARSVDAARLPAAELPARLRDVSPVLISPRLTPTASIAAGHLRWQPHDLAELADAGEMVRSQLLALLSFGVEQPARAPEAPDNLLRTIEAMVEANLADPDLSAKMLCSRLGISRTTLFKALAAGKSSLEALIRQRRLSGCLSDMRRGCGAETLTSLSERWGYRDQTTFSRAFRRQYGRTPTDWLRCGPDDPDPD